MLPKKRISDKGMLFEKLEKRTFYYEYIMAMTNIILAFSIFVGLIVSIFPLIENVENIFGIKVEFLIIVPFILILGVLLYFTDRKLRK